jgi:transposase
VLAHAFAASSQGVPPGASAANVRVPAPLRVKPARSRACVKSPPNAAGVDIGAHAIGACVPDGDDQQIVRPFGTYTAARQTLANWFVDRGLQTGALESTGVYWLPLFEALEARGLQCCLSSAQSLKRVPGRKSDVLDCQWIHTWHSYGLLSASFRPDADFVALRTLLRHRA